MHCIQMSNISKDGTGIHSRNGPSMSCIKTFLSTYVKLSPAGFCCYLFISLFLLRSNKTNEILAIVYFVLYFVACRWLFSLTAEDRANECQCYAEHSTVKGPTFKKTLNILTKLYENSRKKLIYKKLIRKKKSVINK